MRNKVLRWCRDEALFEPGTQVVCALSGGTDSVAMLHCLLSLREELGIHLSAAHYNHHLRGAESDRDEAFVRTLCQTWNVPLIVSGGDVSSRAEQTGESVEEAARKLRYAFLESLDQTIATAHNADDNLETTLLNLLRGTSLRGLCGIPPKRDKIVRPVLCLTRMELASYLKENNLPHVEDSTNAATDVLRNRLRHEVIPLLRRENPSVSETVLRGSLLLRKDEAFLEQLAEQTIKSSEQENGWRCSVLLAQPEAIRSRAVRKLLRRVNAPKLTCAHVESVCALLTSEKPSAQVSLPGGWTARRCYDLFTLQKERASSWQPVRLCIPGTTEIPKLGLRIVCHVEKCLQKKEEFQKSTSTFACKCDMIENTPEIWARPRQTGDEMCLTGGHRSLKRILIDRKIPSSLREELPVFADASGVIGVYNVGCNLDRLPAEGDCAVYIHTERI